MKQPSEKMVIELRDKMGVFKPGPLLQKELDALEALKSLGYSENEASVALKDLSPEFDTNQKIKEALKILSGK